MDVTRKRGERPPGACDGVSVVVPAYNSEQTLRPLVERITATFEALQRPVEVILVNDGSRDDSWREIDVLSARYGHVQGIDLTRNYGQHNALLCGIRTAQYPLIVTIDDDLQNPPEEIPKLLAKLEEGHDVVYGCPEHEQHGFLRDLASRMTKLVMQEAMGTDIAGRISAFRVFRTDLLSSMASYRSAHVNIDVLLTWATTRFEAIYVEHAPRTAGTSNYTLRKLLVHALNMLTGFNTSILRAASVLGLIFAFFGCGVLAFVLIRFLISGSPVRGFPFLASIVAIFSGAQLLSLGIIGEYLARMHYRLMERPVYAVRRTTPETRGDD